MSTDVLGRAAGPRKRRSIEEKRRIVEETLVAGASVPVIARKYEVNANLVFGWRRLYQQGLLEGRDAGVAMAMLPVTRTSPAESRPRRIKRRLISARRRGSQGSIEIRFPGGGALSIRGPI